jgi:outer membrane receptor protein involved in Fe transport
LAPLALSFQPVAAQQPEGENSPDTLVYTLDPLTVTATRTARPVSQTPMPVSVINSRVLQQIAPNTITELFKGLPGLDVTGTGANQGRPMIRGQRGQRILLLQNGIRLNNSRRQQDFGELPALIDISGVERVEVVRGPASVLYGTDAIGGVINIITDGDRDPGIHGRLNYRYGQAQDQHKGTLNLSGEKGGVEFDFVAAIRNADTYSAPAGSFGDLELTEKTPVSLTGVEDKNFSLLLGYRFTPRSRIAIGFERYDADDGGFGFVDPAAYSPRTPEIRITYPFQEFRKFSLNYRVQELDYAFVDQMDVTVYRQSNKRRLDFDFFVAAGPGASIEQHTENVSDLSTLGLRLEAKKLLAEPVLLTYGIDFFEDDSENTDFFMETLTGIVPNVPVPIVTEDDSPNVPNAKYRSLGLFAQGEFEITGKTRIIAGGRYQRIRGESQPTENFTEELGDLEDETLVGSLNVLQEIAPNLTAIGTLGRAFRAPNLVEMFFEGPTPEGSGFQARNTDLVAETSLNFDLGLRYQTHRVSAEAFYFHNKISNGIRIAPTGEVVGELPVFTNVNVGELLFKGWEMALGTDLGQGFGLGGSYTHVDTEDVLEPNNPIGESFSSKYTGWVRYDHPENRFWLQLDGRHQGDQKEVQLGRSPIGELLPAFTVLNARLGVSIPNAATGLTYRLGLSLENLTDELYAEFANAAFFRPEPGRNLTLTVEAVF